MKLLAQWVNMESIRIEDRKAYLLELDQFIKERKSKVNTLLDQLGWNAEKTLKDRKLRTLAENQSDIVLSKHSMLLESDELNCLLGEQISSKLECFSADEMMKNLSTDQRLAIYEHCIKKTGHLSEPEISVAIHPKDGGTKQQMTFAEIVAQKRNAKRRTTRYRTGVSQSYVSELRNLIELQMSALSQYADNNKHRHEKNSLRSPYRSHRRDIVRDEKPIKHKKHKSPKHHR